MELRPHSCCGSSHSRSKWNGRTIVEYLYHKSRIYLCILVMAIILILCTVPSLYVSSQLQPTALCYSTLPDGNITLLSDIQVHPRKPTPGKCIFFHETSCSADHHIKMNARQACAIESAAKLNPDHGVFVLFTSPVGIAKDRRPPKLVRALLHYHNIHLRTVNIWKYAQGTLIEDWIVQDDILFSSAYALFHLSDYMRYLSLYKYGGVYLDMDVIVKANFSNISNFAGAESFEDVAAGIISLDRSSIGTTIGEMFLQDFKLRFSGQAWGNNGPGVITRVLQKVCQTGDVALMNRARCRGFHVLPPSKCYAIGYRDWEKFFKRNETVSVLAAVEDSLIVHFWNKFSIKRRVKKGDGSTYDVLAKQYCPMVYAAAGQQF